MFGRIESTYDNKMKTLLRASNKREVVHDLSGYEETWQEEQKYKYITENMFLMKDISP